MLTREENELLTRTGPGTAMGAFLRRYWIPVVQSGELEAGGRVKRVRLLGELLIAFELTTEQIRGHSDTIDGKLYEIGDRLKGVKAGKKVKHGALKER